MRRILLCLDRESEDMSAAQTGCFYKSARAEAYGRDNRINKNRNAKIVRKNKVVSCIWIC